MHEVLVNRLGGLNLPRKSVVRLTDRPDMTLNNYRGRKTTIQQQLHVYLLRSLSPYDVGKCICMSGNVSYLVARKYGYKITIKHHMNLHMR